MKLKTAAFVLCALLVPTVASALAIGDAIPEKDTRLRNVDGRDISIGEVAGAKGTLVVFTCNHCPYAKAWEGRIVSLGNIYSKSGIGVVAINPNDPKLQPEDGYEQMVHRSSDRGFAFPYAVDSTSGVARAFGATRTPEVFLFDAAGKLAYHGAVDDESENAQAVEEPYLKNALDAVLEGKAPSPAETKALGCSIKFRSGS